MARWAQALPSPPRTSIRLRAPCSFGTRHERGAVVDAPVHMRRREAVGNEALVRVDRRRQHRHEARAVLDQARDEAALGARRARRTSRRRQFSPSRASERWMWKPEPP